MVYLVWNKIDTNYINKHKVQLSHADYPFYQMVVPALI